MMSAFFRLPLTLQSRLSKPHSVPRHRDCKGALRSPARIERSPMPSATFHYRAVALPTESCARASSPLRKRQDYRARTRAPGPDLDLRRLQKRRNLWRSASLVRRCAPPRRSLLHTGTFDAATLNSGVPPSTARFRSRANSPRARSSAPSVLDILRSIKGGKALADSLALHPAYFSALFIQHGAGRRSIGQLGQIFERLSRKIRFALARTNCAASLFRR